jgi:hypothetical protein
MDNIDRSLHSMMRINRYRFIGSHIIPIVIPIIPPYIPPVPIAPIPSPTTPNGQTYVLSDFGENAINNHSTGYESHSARNQVIFNSITKNFRNRCTCFESYKNSVLSYGMVGSNNVLAKASAIDADIIFTPYTDASEWMNGNYQGFVLAVCSHYNNDGQGDIKVGTDNNRHDITPNATTFLNSIAVSSRRDTPTEFKNSTSEGFGMEFFEDCSREALDPFYPDKDIDTAFAELLSTDGVNLTSTIHPNFSNSLEIGEEITVRFSEVNYQNTFVTEIINGGHIVVSPAIDIINTPSIYGWHKTTIGGYM